MPAPVYQTNYNGYVAYKVQSGLNSPSTGAGASIIPLTSGRTKPSKTPIVSNQVRQDGQQVRGRHGTQAASGQYGGELQMGNFDDIIQAVMRGTWAAGASVTNATAAMSSATLSCTSSVITFSAGSVITAGITIFDVITFTSGLNAADLNKPLQIVGMTATTIRVAQPITPVAGPVSTYAFMVKGHKLICPAAGSLVKRYFTIEENEADIDVSAVYPDWKWGGFDLTLQPNGILTFTPKGMNTGAIIVEPSAGAPYFTTPSLPLASASPFASIDCQVVLSDSGLLVDLTALSISVDINLQAPAVAAGQVSPDVFDGTMIVSGSISMLRTDLTQVSDSLAETPLTLQLLASVAGSSPTDFYSFTIPNFTVAAPDVSDFKKDGGPMTQTIPIAKELVGIDTRGAIYDATMLKVQRST